MNELSVLNESGDTQIKWSHDNPEEQAAARQQIADLKAAGYSFFLVTGDPADEVAAGAGELEMRRVEADEIVTLPAAPGPPPEPGTLPQGSEMVNTTTGQVIPPKQRGRPRTVGVAVPRHQGG